AVSKLFRFRLLADAQPYIPTAHLLGQNAVFVIELHPGERRRFLAKINAVEELGTDEHGRTSYALELVPRLWALTQTVRSRVFENLDAFHIVEQVFAGSGIQLRAHTRAGEPVRPYCVQYFESDFDFVARLLEEEGYIYQCGADQDQPTFDIECFPASFPKLGPIPFHEVTGGPEERIGSWRKARILTATTMSARDHFFQAASPVLDGSASVPASSPAIPGWEALNASWSAPVDHYPGQWAHLFEEVHMNGAVSPPSGYTDFGGNRMWHALQQAVGSTSASEAASNCPRLAPMSVFDLVQHASASGEHFVVSVRHKGSQALDHSGHHALEFAYENQFTSVPNAETMMYLPPRVTRKPLIYGCQTAKVVGATGADEIWTDKYGRVQVQFWWDRGSTRSCWIRVASLWAGSGWGMQHVPRVGQEVVVTFLDGDPDRPLIVGSVYNPSQMPPFSLPENKTQSGIRTHSTPGGVAGESNEIRFEDNKGHEEIYLHAQKDRTEVVENDAIRTVGNDSSELVSNDRYDVVSENFHAITTGEKREAITGKSSVTVGDNAMLAFLKKLGIAATEIHLKAGKIVIEADAISIRTTDKSREFIHLSKGGGITIDSKGEQVWVNCGGAGAPDDGCYETPAQPVNPFAAGT
ncbi:MAG TPA: type VI secretion system tip protein TssI/VgrG, partial [Bryobacteraceae bacterium]